MYHLKATIDFESFGNDVTSYDLSGLLPYTQYDVIIKETLLKNNINLIYAWLENFNELRTSTSSDISDLAVMYVFQLILVGVVRAPGACQDRTGSAAGWRLRY